MQFDMLFAKIHRATVTEADLDYVGSIGICRSLCDAAGILDGQKVLVADIDNGNRFETYVIVLDEPGAVVTNGAAAHLAVPG
ncbi:MAG: aspartate 1-decarboxylase, partial [Planctomycetes bacterium]|nr:aspartate 1-decarboxylase [Planctomycetota bacterium]